MVWRLSCIKTRQTCWFEPATLLWWRHRARLYYYFLFFTHERATQSTGWRIQLFMQQTEKLALLRFCQWGQADEHICQTQIPLKFTLKSCRQLLQILKKLLETLLHCRLLSFTRVCKCHSFALITKQLYMMLFKSILKSALGNALRTDGRLWSACIHSPGWLEGRCAALNDLGCFSVWHVAVGY